MTHEEIPVCLKHGEPLTLWNGHPFCPICDARDDLVVGDA
jgi:hypothetical protein